jgi:tetratricopeptide (TPR) repeat protein
MIGAALVAAGYGVYHYVSEGADRNEISNAPLAVLPSPSAKVSEPRKPSPKPAAAVTPPPEKNSGLRDRQDDRRSADKHFENAQALYRQGHYQAALSECRKAIGLYPQHREARELHRKINDLITILNPR